MRRRRYSYRVLDQQLQHDLAWEGAMNSIVHDPQRSHSPNWPADQILRDREEDRFPPLQRPPERARYLESGWDEA